MAKNFSKAARNLSIALMLGIVSASDLAQAQAWQAAAGRIQSINLSYDTNSAFRIIVMAPNGSNPLNSCTGGFVFINNIAGENYQAKTAALLTAYSQGKTVAFNYVVQSDGFCRMTDMTF